MRVSHFPSWRGGWWLAPIVWMLLFSLPGLAQGGNAALTGRVLDPSGGAIAGAQVTVTQSGTGVTRSVLSNHDGAFSVPALPPAQYQVMIAAKGFERFVEVVPLLADQTRSLAIGLHVGAAEQTVTVHAGSAMVNTVSPVLSQVIEHSRVVNLPLNGRNAADLTLLVPGTVTAPGDGTQQGTTKQAPGTESIAVNGARPDQISYNLDGGDNEDSLSNTNDPFPFPDALQEFSVQTNNFDAQYGGNAGAVVNVVTRSGGNAWHGDAFEFVRNKIFNARNYFAKTVDPLKRNQFGGTIGGPINRNHSFVFFGYQGTRIRSVTNANTAFVPTAANLGGDFSAYESATNPANPTGKVIQIIDPATGQPYLNDIIPQSDLNPVAANFAKYLPIGSAAPNGFVVYSKPLSQNLNELVSRFDQTVRGQDLFTFRYYLDRFTAAPTYDGKNLLTVGDGSTVQSQNYLTSYTWVGGPALVNHTVLSFLRTASDRSQGGNVPQLGAMGANLGQLPAAQGGIRGFGVSGFFGVGDFTDGRFIRNSGDVRDVATWTRGNHTIAFGGDYERDQDLVRNTDLENGSFNFTSDTTNLAAASFVLGHMQGFTQTSGNYSDQRQNVAGLFVQDQWHATRRLTLNLGLRWEPQVPMKEYYGRIQQFFPNANAAGVHSQVFPNAPAGLFFVGDSYQGVGVPATGETGDLDNLAPRFGFAYDVTGHGSTVVRGGVGVFYESRLPGLFGNDASIVPPFSLSLSLTQPQGSLSDPLLGYSSFESGFPQRFTLSTAPKTVAFPSPVRVFGLEPNHPWVTPSIYSWNLTVEHSLSADTLLQLAYVGTKGSHLREDINLNPAVYLAGSKLSTDQRRVYSGFSNILEDSNAGTSIYNALQVSLEKRVAESGRLSHLTLLTNYTWSKAMDTLPTSGGGITDLGSTLGSGMPYGSAGQRAFDTGLSDFNHTHRLVASYVWQLPQMNSSGGWLRSALGGWSWSGIFTMTSGDALTLMAGRDQSQTGLGGDRAQFIGSSSQFGAGAVGAGGCRAGQTCVPWLIPALFAEPAIGQFGNVGKGAFTGPAIWNTDMGLIKNFYPVHSNESLRLQIRGDFFNVFNHAEFNDPSTTVSDAGFGGIRSARDPRIIQLALKLFF